jgi:hypothetical protein
MTETIPEIFTKISNAKSNRDRKSILLKHDTFGLRTVLQGAYHPDIVLQLPPGSPPYTEDSGPLGHTPSTLEFESKKFMYFVSGPNFIENKKKREDIFIQMLESVHPTEAAVMLAVKDKSLNVKGLTYDLIKDVFPQLALPDLSSEKVKEA